MTAADNGESTRVAVVPAEHVCERMAALRRKIDRAAHLLRFYGALSWQAALKVLEEPEDGR